MEEKFGKCPRKETEVEDVILFSGAAADESGKADLQSAESFIRMKFTGVVVLTLCLHHMSSSSAQVRTGDRQDVVFIQMFLIANS